MDLDNLKERFNLQKLVEEFKAVIDDQPVTTLDTKDPVGQGLSELLSLVKKLAQLQDEQRKTVDQIIALLGAVVQKAATSPVGNSCKRGRKQSEDSTGT